MPLQYIPDQGEFLRIARTAGWKGMQWFGFGLRSKLPVDE